MDAKKTVRKYIAPGAWMSVTGIAALILAVVLTVIGVGMDSSVDTSQAELFHPLYSQTGTLGYLDIVGVSDWIYQYDDDIYYAAEDADGYLYTVQLSRTQFAKMAKQNTYWFRESDTEAAPEPYRLYGMVRRISTTTKQNLSEWWEVTQDEYEDYFGTLFLDGTTTPQMRDSGMVVFAAMMAFMYALIVLAISLPVQSAARKSLKHLEEQGQLERAAEELAGSAGALVIGKNRAVLTQNFLFGRKTGVAAEYRDILWCYKKTMRYNFVAVNDSLILNTRTRKNLQGINMGGVDRNNEPSQAMMTIYQHNDRLLVGFTKENKKAYKEALRQMV